MSASPKRIRSARKRDVEGYPSFLWYSIVLWGLSWTSQYNHVAAFSTATLLGSSSRAPLAVPTLSKTTTTVKTKTPLPPSKRQVAATPDFYSTLPASPRNDTTSSLSSIASMMLKTPPSMPLLEDQHEHMMTAELETQATTSTSTTTTTTTMTQEKLPPISKIDVGTFGIHFCAAVTMTLPVMIVPMMDAEMIASNMLVGGVGAATTLAATMASMAPMGNGIGKLINGVVCQQYGGAKSSRLYFVGSALASLALACVTLTGTSTLTSTGWGTFLTPHYLGYFVAAIEFCASIQWTVCSLFLSQYYKKSPALFARGITILSLSSTGGQIISKVAGAALLQFVHWRHVARISVMAAIVGLNLSLWTSRNMKRAKQQEQQLEIQEQQKQQQQRRLELEHQQPQLEQQQREAHSASATIIVDSAANSAAMLQPPPPPQQHSSSTVSALDNTKKASDTNIRQAVGRVLGSKVFWLIGLAHVSGYLTRTSDRILGTFLQEITSLSPQVCGGLTAFMTVGFLYGLVTTSRKFHRPVNHNDSNGSSNANALIEPKLRLLRNGYIRYLVSAGGLVLSAAFGRQWHPYVSAGIITTCASVMAASIAFPFFQVPNMVSSIYFGEVKPVALSMIDGTGVFLTSPIWKIFTGMLLPTFGWSFSWSVVAMIVGLCGTLLMSTIPKVLHLQLEQQQQQEEEQQQEQQQQQPQ